MVVPDSQFDPLTYLCQFSIPGVLSRYIPEVKEFWEIPLCQSRMTFYNPFPTFIKQRSTRGWRRVGGRHIKKHDCGLGGGLNSVEREFIHKGFLELDQNKDHPYVNEVLTTFNSRSLYCNEIKKI